MVNSFIKDGELKSSKSHLKKDDSNARFIQNLIWQ